MYKSQEWKVKKEMGATQGLLLGHFFWGARGEMGWVGSMDSPSEKGKSYLCVPFTFFLGGSPKIAPALCT